jgi:regulator of replication initiation timing
VSLLEPYRKLREQNQRLLEENRILLLEIRMLKKLLYDFYPDKKPRKQK